MTTALSHSLLDKTEMMLSAGSFVACARPRAVGLCEAVYFFLNLMIGCFPTTFSFI